MNSYEDSAKISLKGMPRDLRSQLIGHLHFKTADYVVRTFSQDGAKKPQVVRSEDSIGFNVDGREVASVRVHGNNIRINWYAPENARDLPCMFE